MRSADLAVLVVAASVIAAPASLACPTASTGASCGSALAAPNASFDARGGAKRIVVAPTSPRFAAGDRLPAGRYSVLLNSAYYGLPPTGGDWVYYRAGHQALRVRPDTLEVLEDVTEQTNAAF